MTADDGRRRRVELSSESLSRLDPRISVPSYDRSALGGGIVHIGVGGFHRAHQAVYLDDVCRAGVNEWSITGAGVLAADARMAESLAAQDHLYTLITRDERGTDARVIGSITGYVLSAGDLEPLVARLADAATRIVSMTITEGGYPVDESSGEFAPPSAGELPPTFVSLARAFQARRDAGHAGLTVQSCDNVMGNGDVTKVATLGVCALVEPGLEAWVADHVTFPNSMVDRITPQTSDADRAFLSQEYGLVDRWPVVAETFIQWVIEDDFVAGRPPYEDVGVLMTRDVRPYETLKLRILNAGHSALTYMGALVGHTYIHEIMANLPLARYLQQFHDQEVTPSLPPVGGVDIPEYKRVVAQRFANPEVRDQVSRVCQDGTSKWPKFLVPTVESQLERGGQVKLSALALAAWCQYLLGRDDAGAEMTLAGDPRLDEAQAFARASVDEPAAFLGFTDVFGQRLAADRRFVMAFTEALASLREAGVYGTLERWLDRDAS
ncbi:MAG: mannitol dehydrogenase family protein [Candidatus Limnocylindrales bacterium]